MSIQIAPKSVAGKLLVPRGAYYANLANRAAQQAQVVAGLYGDPFLTANQACMALGVSYSTIRKWLRTGLLHGQRTSARGRYRFRSSEIQRVAAMAVVE